MAGRQKYGANGAPVDENRGSIKNKFVEEDLSRTGRIEDWKRKTRIQSVEIIEKTKYNSGIQRRYDDDIEYMIPI